VQTLRGLIIGPAGSGKSTLARTIVREMMRGPSAPARLIVIDTSDEWADHVDAHVEVDHEASAKAGRVRWDDVLARHRRVLFELTTPDPEPFAAAIGQAIMRVGDALVVIDEAHHIAHPKAPLAFLAVWTGGRKRGVHALAITQRITQAQRVGLSMTVLNNSTTAWVFRATEPRELDKLGQLLAPEIAEKIPALRPPGPDNAPDYAVYDMRTGRGVIVNGSSL